LKIQIGSPSGRSPGGRGRLTRAFYSERKRREKSNVRNTTPLRVQGSTPQGVRGDLEGRANGTFCGGYQGKARSRRGYALEKEPYSVREGGKDAQRVNENEIWTGFGKKEDREGGPGEDLRANHHHQNSRHGEKARSADRRKERNK